MRPRRAHAAPDSAEIFARAAKDHALAVLTVQDGVSWCTFKSRFLERDAGRRFVVLDYVADEHAPLPTLSVGQYVGISLRQGSRKMLFTSTVQARGHFVLDGNLTVPAVRYRWPEQITELQRRVYYRTPVPADIPVSATLWPGGAALRAADDSRRDEIVGRLRDVSCGGAQVLFESTSCERFDAEQLVGVELALPDGQPPVVLDARTRGLRVDERFGPSVALQFVGLEISDSGRQALRRLALFVQRLYRINNPFQQRRGAGGAAAEN